MENGFTFIKTIILIFAVFIIIVSVTIFNYMKKMDTKIARDTAYDYIDVVETFIIRQMLQQNNFIFNGTFNVDENGNIDAYSLPIASNSKPSGGYLEISNSKVTNGCLTINKFKVEINDGKVNKVVKGKCG